MQYMRNNVETKVDRARGLVRRSRPFFDALAASAKTLAQHVSSSVIKAGLSAYRWVGEKLDWMKREFARIRHICRDVAAWLGKVTKLGVEAAKRVLQWALKMIRWVRAKVERLRPVLRKIARMMNTVHAILRVVMSIHTMLTLILPTLARGLALARRAVRSVAKLSVEIVTLLARLLTGLAKGERVLLTAGRVHVS